MCSEWYWQISNLMETLIFSPEATVTTVHLNGKNLSTNSSWDFEHILHTMNPYWLCTDEQFCPIASGSRWRCDSLQQLFQKMLKMKNGHHFQAKKTFATPKFCKWTFSQMHRFEDMNFLSITAPFFVVQKKLGSGCARGKLFIWEESVEVHSVYNTIKVPGGIIA